MVCFVYVVLAMDRCSLKIIKVYYTAVKRNLHPDRPVCVCVCACVCVCVYCSAAGSAKLKSMPSSQAPCATLLNCAICRELHGFVRRCSIHQNKKGEGSYVSD